MKYSDEYWQDCIDEIMDEFDFNKVATCMFALNWHWYDREGVPTERDIRSYARKLLKEKRSVQTGGFRIIWDKEDGSVSMEFIITDWCAYKELEAA